MLQVRRERGIGDASHRATSRGDRRTNRQGRFDEHGLESRGPVRSMPFEASQGIVVDRGMEGDDGGTDACLVPTRSSVAAFAGVAVAASMLAGIAIDAVFAGNAFSIVSARWARSIGRPLRTS